MSAGPSRDRGQGSREPYHLLVHTMHKTSMQRVPNRPAKRPVNALKVPLPYGRPGWVVSAITTGRRTAAGDQGAGDAGPSLATRERHVLRA